MVQLVFFGNSGVDAVNLTNTYVNFKFAGTNNDWCYIRQIGGDNAFKLAFDFHDDDADARFCIRKIQSTLNPDSVVEVFTVDNGNVSCTGTLTVGSYANAKYGYLGGLRIGGWDGNTLYQDVGDLGITVHNTTPKITFNFFGGNNTIMDIKNTSINFYQPVYFANNVWHSSGEGAYRLFFGNNGPSYIAGGSLAATDPTFLVYASQTFGYATIFTILNNGDINTVGNLSVGKSVTINGNLILNASPGVATGSINIAGYVTCNMQSIANSGTDLLGTYNVASITSNNP